jgi:hypothetical protein
LSIFQGPFSVAPCQTLISRFATFASPYVAGDQYRATETRIPQAGTLTLVFEPADGGPKQEMKVPQR